MKGKLLLLNGEWLVQHKEQIIPLHPLDTPPDIVEDDMHVFDGTNIDFEIMQLEMSGSDALTEVAKVIFPNPYGDIFN